MLKPEHFSYQCPLKISDLEKTEDGHFCAKCSKDIHDLSDCSIEDIIELQRRKGSICGFVRAVSLTSMVGLAACSKSGDQASQDHASGADATPGKHAELIGEVTITDDDIAQPEADQPETPEKDGDSTVTPDGKPPRKPAKPDVIDAIPDVIDAIPDVIEIDGPVLLGIICPPDQLKPEKPEEPKALDPHRDGSPG